MPADPSKIRGWIWIAAGAVIAITAITIALGVELSRPQSLSRADYPQSTPDEVIASAFAMIEDARPHQLTDLIHADSDDMRAVLNRLGRLFKTLEDLAVAANNAFPKEVAELKAQAEQQQGGGIFAALTNPPRDSAEQREQTNLVARILADPFGWLQRARDRITTIQTADNIAAVMIDGKPAFGLGLTMRLEDDRWQVMLPLRLPFISRYMPQTREEWAILASLVEVIDSAVDELAGDVRAGRCRDIEAVAELAGEKAWMPVVMCVMAYNRAMESRERSPGAPAVPGGGEPSMRGMRF